MDVIFLMMILGTCVSLGATQEKNHDSILIEPHKLALRGAMVDNYRKEVVAIKLMTPSEIVKDTLDNLILTKIPENERTKLLLTVGEIEKSAMEKFNILMHTIVDTLPLTTLLKEPSPELPKSFLHQSRSKRSPLRLFLSVLRMARPIARVAPVAANAGKYAKFVKALKYTGYAASAAAISYEAADAAGLIPDHRYEALKEAFQELSADRNKDLTFMGNLTLSTMKFQEETYLNSRAFQKIILDKTSNLELYLKGSTLFNNYLDQLQLSLLLLLNGKLTDFLISTDTQRAWLETKLPTYLLSYIGTITPTFDIEFSGYDFNENSLFITLNIPEPGKSFQLLNFVQWEPMIKIGSKCYTSPEPFFYLAYPTTVASDIKIIEDPLIFDSRSCLNNGFILCESDALLPNIPDIKFDKFCSQTRFRRDLTPFLNQTSFTKYNLTNIITTSLKDKILPEEDNRYIKIRSELEDLHQQIVNEQKRRETSTSDLLQKLKEAEESKKMYNLLFILLILAIVMIHPLYKGTTWLIKRREMNRNRQTEIMRELQNLGNIE